VLEEDAQGLEQALAAHQAILEGQMRQISATVEKMKRLRDDLASGNAPPTGEFVRLLTPADEPAVAFDLPLPWGGTQTASSISSRNAETP
jgi:hypothetical protein